MVRRARNGAQPITALSRWRWQTATRSACKASIASLQRRDGREQRMAVMAIWTLRDGKVSALREVEAEI